MILAARMTFFSSAAAPAKYCSSPALRSRRSFEKLLALVVIFSFLFLVGQSFLVVIVTGRTNPGQNPMPGTPLKPLKLLRITPLPANISNIRSFSGYLLLQRAVAA